MLFGESLKWETMIVAGYLSSSLIASLIRYLAASKYIRNLATLVVCYGMSINLVEVTWKCAQPLPLMDLDGP